jgi:hypothetical protein
VVWTQRLEKFIYLFLLKCYFQEGRVIFSLLSFGLPALLVTLGGLVLIRSRRVMGPSPPHLLGLKQVTGSWVAEWGEQRRTGQEGQMVKVNDMELLPDPQPRER